MAECGAVAVKRRFSRVARKFAISRRNTYDHAPRVLKNHKFMRTIIALCLVLASLPATADLSDDALGSAFVSGLRAYEEGQYERAVTLFEAVIAAQPDCARCAHLLGKSYGNLADRAGWTEAIGLAKKTRIALEQAVELAPNDAEAIRDLIKYYRAAPGFLGGSEEKANALERRLHEDGTEHTS